MTGLMVSVVSFIAGVNNRIKSNEKGATMVEYGIMIAFIALLVLGAVTLLGPQIANLFTQVDNAI